jgi:uncharacterized protein
VTLRAGAADTCLLELVLVRPKTERTESGRIALVIDDFGDRKDGLVQAFFDLKTPVTVSIIPGRKYSSTLATEAVKKGHETMLHLTMEPIDKKVRDDGYIILTGMSRSQIQTVIDRSLKDVPGVLGVNNHMGSKATQDRAVMTPVLQTIGDRGLFFMDSYTIAASAAFPLARELGVRTARRDVFLDAVRDAGTIRAKFDELARKARKNGSAIGLGHCHQAMFDVLSEEIPRLEAKGYRFAFLSEIVQ